MGVHQDIPEPPSKAPLSILVLKEGGGSVSLGQWGIYDKLIKDYNPARTEGDK